MTDVNKRELDLRQALDEKKIITDFFVNLGFVDVMCFLFPDDNSESEEECEPS